ncbi:hypothetical protein EKH55_0821 [Sinorhizobium alkalisoli]|nr:hypothetical protein EKH55_0821 [Sinorhizobium alkalisoli]
MAGGLQICGCLYHRNFIHCGENEACAPRVSFRSTCHNRKCQTTLK